MKKIFSKVKVTAFFAILILVCGVFLGYRIFGENKSIFSNSNILSRSLSKPVSLETVVTKVSETKEINVLETEVSQNFVLDDSWMNISLFKKTQVINFSGTGIYSVNLIDLNQNDITVDENNKKISIKLDKPYVKLVTINEEKTQYTDMQTGLLRKGEVNLAPSEYLKISEIVKERMKNKLEEADMYNSAVDSSTKVVSELIKSILISLGNDDYNVDISYK